MWQAFVRVADQICLKKEQPHEDEHIFPVLNNTALRRVKFNDRWYVGVCQKNCVYETIINLDEIEWQTLSAIIPEISEALVGEVAQDATPANATKPKVQSKKRKTSVKKTMPEQKMKKVKRKLDFRTTESGASGTLRHLQKV